MTEVIDTTRLHTKTVSEYEQHLRKRPRRPPVRSRMVIKRVDPRVWRVARDIARGNPSVMIEVRSETEVVIVNKR